MDDKRALFIYYSATTVVIISIVFVALIDDMVGAGVQPVQALPPAPPQAPPLVQTPFQFYLVLSIFVGFGAGAMGQLATSKLVSNWFVRKRGTALGIAAAGISVSGVILPNISAYPVTEFGWRSGFLVYGLVILTLVVTTRNLTPTGRCSTT